MKSARIDVTVVEFLKNGEETAVKWLTSSCNGCLNNETVSEDWKVCLKVSVKKEKKKKRRFNGFKKVTWKTREEDKLWEMMREETVRGMGEWS